MQYIRGTPSERTLGNCEVSLHELWEEYAALYRIQVRQVYMREA